MPNNDLLRRITADSGIFGGKPIVRGLRISVNTVLSLLAQGATHSEILSDYPFLEEEDILACIEYARAAIANESLDAVEVAPR